MRMSKAAVRELVAVLVAEHDENIEYIAAKERNDSVEVQDLLFRRVILANDEVNRVAEKYGLD